MVLVTATAAEAEPRCCTELRLHGMLLSASLNSRRHSPAPQSTIIPQETAQDSSAEGLRLQEDTEISWSSDAAEAVQQADRDRTAPQKQTTPSDSPLALTLLQSFYQDLRVAGLLLKSSLNSAVQEGAPSVETTFAATTTNITPGTPPFPVPEQMGVAVSYTFIPGVSADLNYRLQNSAELRRIYNDLANTGTNVTSHEISAGMRFEF